MSNHRSTALAVALLYQRRGSSSTPNDRALGVYQNKFFYSVPPHPSLQRSKCGIISLKGKIFVLGGEENSDTKLASQEVHAFDLVDRTWTRCANMQGRRMSFGTGALDDKIYVFGGSNCGVPFRVSEVYDPAANVWSTIADMMECRTNHQVAVLGKFFIVYGGVLHQMGVESDGTLRSSDNQASYSQWDGAYLDVSPSAVLIYGPEKNHWVKSYNADGVNNSVFKDNVFVVKGKYHRFTSTGDGIEKFNVGRKSWSLLHGLVAWDDGLNHDNLNDLPDNLDLGLGSGQAVMVDGELLTVCHLGSNTVPGAARLVQTNGFGRGHDVLVLELLQSFREEFEEESTILFPLDL